MESLKHRIAKETLARWLAEPGQKLIGEAQHVFTEYPICVDTKNRMHGTIPWHETGPCIAPPFRNRPGELRLPGTPDQWAARPPTYGECLAMALLPLVIFDVAVHNEGLITHAFEIVHSHDITENKRRYLDRIFSHCSHLSVHGIEAHWVLSQHARPNKLQTLWTL